MSDLKKKKDMRQMMVTLTNFFAVRICESRLGAPGFTELRPRSLGRHQVSFFTGFFGSVGSSRHILENKYDKKR